MVSVKEVKKGEYDYIIKNYKKYNMSAVKNEEEMKMLLNILEAHGETLESMHDFVCDEENSMFCNIFFERCEYGKYIEITMDAVAEAIFISNSFYETKEKYLETMETFSYTREEAEERLRAELKNGEIKETRNGFVYVDIY